MKYTLYRIIVLILALVFAFSAVGLCACGREYAVTEESSTNYIPTNPNDDGFGTEVIM